MNLTSLLVRTIIEQSNPKEASKILIHKYNDGEPDYLTRRSKAIYSTWSRVRSLVVSNEDNRNPRYTVRLTNLLRNVLPQHHKDRPLLQKLFESSLRQQHAVYCDKKAYFKDPEVDAAVKRVKPANPLLYDFVLPKEVQEARKEQIAKTAILHQQHRLKHKEEYVMPRAQVDGFINSSIQLLESLDSRYNTIIEESPTEAACSRRVKQLAFDTVIALQMLTGRRNHEVLSSLKIQPKPECPYQAICTGILKNDKLKADGRTYTIPLLAHYHLIERGLQFVRKYIVIPETMTASVVNSMTSKNIITASKRLLGKELHHTQRRNLYIDTAWDRRKQNEFLSGQSCCKAVWTARGLSHCDPGVPSVTQRYQAMVIED